VPETRTQIAQEKQESNSKSREFAGGNPTRLSPTGCGSWMTAFETFHKAANFQELQFGFIAGNLCEGWSRLQTAVDISAGYEIAHKL
jgi:hypothetical protein